MGWRRIVSLKGKEEGKYLHFLVLYLHILAKCKLMFTILLCIIHTHNVYVNETLASTAVVRICVINSRTRAY